MILKVINSAPIILHSKKLLNVSFPIMKFAVTRRTTNRYQLIGETIGGRRLKIIFQLKLGNIVRLITGWEI